MWHILIEVGIEFVSPTDDGHCVERNNKKELFDFLKKSANDVNLTERKRYLKTDKGLSLFFDKFSGTSEDLLQICKICMKKRTLKRLFQWLTVHQNISNTIKICLSPVLPVRFLFPLRKKKIVKNHKEPDIWVFGLFEWLTNGNFRSVI